MDIEIGGLGHDRGLAARVRRRLAAALRGLTVKPVTAVATFVDDNGPKGGPAIRCALTLRLPYRPSLRVEATALVPGAAFDGAIDTLERQIDRYRDRQRDSRRRPKKYYAAKRRVE
jgi:ribosome-associated translation inhibitor RaiA